MQIKNKDEEILLCELTGKTASYLYAYPEFKLSIAQQKIWEAWHKRLRAHEPIAYILGHTYFCGLKLKVNRHTLIPRPETELLVEHAINLVSHPAKSRSILVDVGTGSGAIAIALAKKLSNKIIAIDVSKRALAVARDNAREHLVTARIQFTYGNIVESAQTIARLHPNKQHIIVANLPYVSPKDYARLSSSVKNYEPKLALYAKENGLYLYRRLLEQLSGFAPAKGPGVLAGIFEIAPQQVQAIIILIQTYLPEYQVTVLKDYAKKDRFVIFQNQQSVVAPKGKTSK